MHKETSAKNQSNINEAVEELADKAVTILNQNYENSPYSQ